MCLRATLRARCRRATTSRVAVADRLCYGHVYRATGAGELLTAPQRDAEAGKEVFIVRRGIPVAKLIAFRKKLLKKRSAGHFKHLIKINPTFYGPKLKTNSTIGALDD